MLNDNQQLYELELSFNNISITNAWILLLLQHELNK